MSPLLALLVAATPAALAGIELEQAPAIGVETVVAVSDAEGRPRRGETVRVVHRPGLDGEREMAVGITDGRGRVRWTPALAGVARLRAGDEILPVAIGWSGVPAGPATLLALLLLSGLAAFLWGIVPAGRVRG